MGNMSYCRLRKPIPILSSIMAILILGLTFIVIDQIASKPEAFYGNVIDKHYKAERTSVGTGTSVGSNGSVGVVTTTEVDPEEFLIMVKTESGKIVTVNCEPELYYQKEVGERIDCNAYKGLFTGMVWSLHGVR
jgi:hypothetical protein